MPESTPPYPNPPTSNTTADSESLTFDGRTWVPEERVRALEEGLRGLIDNLSLYGCCPANNCASEDADGLSGLRDPEPHSDGCAYVAARDLLSERDENVKGDGE